MKFIAILCLSCLGCNTLMADDMLIIDDRRTGTLDSALGTAWRMITDGVMGGVSNGKLMQDTIDNRACLRLRGDVRVENSGGFIQAALDVEDTSAADASGYHGVQMEIYGNEEAYNLHLRTHDVWLPWQSYRASFLAPASWHTVRVPFAEFSGYRIGKPLDRRHLERIGVVAIGRAFKADLCIASLGFYREKEVHGK